MLRGSGDFHIEESDAEGFFDAAGIESPGLSAAPAIGEYLCTLVSKRIELKAKDDYINTRCGVIHLSKMSDDEKNELIKKDPSYGRIVCRCESITEGEILDAINRPLGATTLDGVKRRTRAGMGRCQGGFCSPYVIKLLSQKLGISMRDVRKNGR